MSTHQGRQSITFGAGTPIQTNRGEIDSNFQWPLGVQEEMNRFFLNYLLGLPEVSRVFLEEIERESKTINKYWIFADTDDSDFARFIYEYELELSQAFDSFTIDSHVFPTEEISVVPVPSNAIELYNREQ